MTLLPALRGICGKASSVPFHHQDSDDDQRLLIRNVPPTGCGRKYVPPSYWLGTLSLVECLQTTSKWNRQIEGERRKTRVRWISCVESEKLRDSTQGRLSLLFPVKPMCTPTARNVSRCQHNGRKGAVQEGDSPTLEYEENPLYQLWAQSLLYAPQAKVLFTPIYKQTDRLTIMCLWPQSKKERTMLSFILGQCTYIGRYSESGEALFLTLGRFNSSRLQLLMTTIRNRGQ